MQRYHPIQTKEATILVSALLESPENREQHIQRTAASVIMSITYDYPTLAPGQDKAVRNMDRNVQSSARAATGTSLVEFFPWMLHVPQRSMFFPLHNISLPHSIPNQRTNRFAKWKREALKRAAERSEMYLRLFNHVKTDLVNSFITMCGHHLNDSTDKRRGPSMFQCIVNRKS